MATATPSPTTIRWRPEDRELLARLRKLTGVSTDADAVRLGIKEAVAAREGRLTPPGRGS
ncbi:MAG TPA: hypothetical protein VF765_11075 [Polyangiaceae bacterium]